VSPVTTDGWSLLKAGSKKSHVWTRFGAVRYASSGGNKIFAVRCNICFVSLSFNNNTFFLRQHLLSRHAAEYDIVVSEEKHATDALSGAQPGVEGQISAARPQWTNHKHAIVNKMWVKWVVKECLPLETLRKDSLREAVMLSTGGAYNGCMRSSNDAHGA